MEELSEDSFRQGASEADGGIRITITIVKERKRKRMRKILKNGGR